MATEIVFNGKQFKDTKSLKSEIKKIDPEELTFTGSLVFNKGLEMIVFNTVNYSSIKYYINEFNKISKNSEVKFEFQTNDGNAKRI